MSRFYHVKSVPFENNFYSVSVCAEFKKLPKFGTRVLVCHAEGKPAWHQSQLVLEKLLLLSQPVVVVVAGLVNVLKLHHRTLCVLLQFCCLIFETHKRSLALLFKNSTGSKTVT